MEENIQDNIEATQQPEQAPEVNPHADNAASVNMANLRAAKDKAERENAAIRAELEEMRKNNLDVDDDGEDEDYGDEDFVEGKHLKTEIDSVKKQLEAYKMQQVANTDEERLKRTYSDFESVVNPASIAKLKELDPESADTIAMSRSSLYSRGSAAYKRIKELNLVDTHAGDRANAEANVAKPRPSNSVSPQTGDSPLSMANAFSNGLTPDLKKQLWKEMQDAAKKH